MVDVSSEARIKVVVEGEEQIPRLTAAIAALNREAGKTQTINAAAGARPSSAPGRPPQAPALPLPVIPRSYGERLGEQFGRNVLAPALKAPFQVVAAATQVAGVALFGLAGPLALVAARFPPVALGITALGAALTGLAVPLLQVIASVKLMTLSFQWAQEEAQEALRIRAAARRYYPGASGAELKRAEDAIETSMETMSSLIGESAHGIQERVNKRLRDVRLGKGLFGDREAFQRWGITPESRDAFERQAGKRLDLTDWTRQWILQRERLQKTFDEAPPGPRKDKTQHALAELAEFTAQLYGPKVAEVIQSFSSADFAKLQAGIAQTQKLGESHADTAQNAIELTIATTKVHTAFNELTKGIARDVNPAITDFLDTLHGKLAGGLGQSLRALGSAITIRGFETLTVLLKGFAPTIENITTAINEMKPADTAAGIKSWGEGLVSVGSSIWNVVQGTEALLVKLDAWLVWLNDFNPIERERQNVNRPAPQTALEWLLQGPRTLERRFDPLPRGGNAPPAAPGTRAWPGTPAVPAWPSDFMVPPGAAPSTAPVESPWGPDALPPSGLPPGAASSAPAPSGIPSGAPPGFSPISYVPGGGMPEAAIAPRIGAGRSGLFLPPPAGAPPGGGLADVRSRFAGEMANPAVRDRLAAYTQAEVGGQGPEAQQAFMESIFNRAAARNQSIETTLSGKYFPGSTHARAARGVSEDQRARYGPMAESVLAGSNVSNFATGNASGTVGFGGGPQTFAAGGERFGIEGADRGWAARQRAGGGPIIVPPSVAAAVAAGGGGDRMMPGRNLKGTDPRLAEIVGAAARGLPEGYKIQPTSGLRDPRAPGFHPSGRATDWQIIGPDGKPVSNRGEDSTGLYTQLARNAYGYQEAMHPELTGTFQWGGQFGTSKRNPNEPDLMHFDIGGRRGRLSRYSREAIGATMPPAETADLGGKAPPSAAVPYAEFSRQMGGAPGGLDGRKLGSEFGNAAAESFRSGVDGVSVPLDTSDTSRGVPPRSAPKAVGGDSATEA